MAEVYSLYDAADYLKSAEEMSLYLDACMAEGDPVLTAHAFGVIARVHGLGCPEVEPMEKRRKDGSE
ncbi:MAG: hypothetical protein HQL56_11845 [Magnetococcales bacterium]|nr:hypothetical protein [Magnetococcales bacterium]